MRYKKIFISFVVCFFMAVFSTNALTYTTFFSNKLVNGVRYQQYYVWDAASGYNSLISNAMHDWEYPVGCSNPIYFTKTSDYASSSIDFYSTYVSSSELSIMGGWTDFYYYGVISPRDRNWLSAQITINQYRCPTTCPC